MRDIEVKRADTSTQKTNKVKAESKQLSENENSNLLYETMIDYVGTIDPSNYVLIEDADFEQDNPDLKYNTASKSSYLFYLENPPSETIGYDDANKITIFKARPCVNSSSNTAEQNDYAATVDDCNMIDGDTIQFFADTIQDSGTEFSVGARNYASFSKFIETKTSDVFKVRLLGINTPEITHYAYVTYKTTPSIKKRYFKNAKVSPSEYVMESANHEDNDILTFLKIEDTYYEIVDTKSTVSNQNTYYSYKIVTTNGAYDKDQQYINEGLKAKKIVLEALEQATDILIVADNTSLTRKVATWPADYANDAYLDTNNALLKVYNYIKNEYDQFMGTQRYRYQGFNAPGTDGYGRLLGAVYVKLPVSQLGNNSSDKWINLAKYVLYNCREETEALPSYTDSPTANYHNGFVSNAFKLYSYDIDGMEIIDSYVAGTDNFIQERNAFYEKTTGFNIETIREYKLILGDAVFVIPPTSIKCTTQTAHERIPLLRAHNAAVKSSPHSERMIELHLYFNEDDGINGKPVICQLPSGEKVVYYMNGLRSLLAMFKLTPFLPIENNYINKTLDIEAVTLVNIQITTIPSYPKTLKAILTLQEFNYSIYMPDLPKSTDTTYNLFASCIHYPVMRWYYQRLLQNGNALKDMTYNSDEYIQATYGHNTALIPMNFTDPGIRFYIPDENQLKKRLQAVLERQPIITQYKLTENMKTGIKSCHGLLDAVNSTLSDSTLISKLQELTSVKTYHSDVAFPVSTSEFTEPIETQEITTYPIVYNESSSTGTVRSQIWPNNYCKYFLKRTYLTFFKGMPEDDSNTEYAIQPTINDYINGFGQPNVDLQNTLQEICQLIGSQLNLYGTIEIQENVTFNNFVDCNYTLQILIPVPKELYKTEYELSLLYRKIATDLGNTTYLTYNSAGVLCIPIDISCQFKDYATYCKKTPDSSKNVAFRCLGNFTPDYTCNGFVVLHYLSNMSDDNTDSSDVGDDAYQNQTELHNELEDITLNSGLGLKFQLYDIGDVLVESIACSYTNSFSRISLKMMDGYAFQYCGGQDMAIEISLITQDLGAVTLIQQLPICSAYYCRNYRQVLNCWPLRIDTEFTKFIGVNEVIIESVTSETVENQPGVVRLNLVLYAVDRTTRAREALKKIDVTNNAGSVQDGKQVARNMRTMFDLKEQLAKAELYPDLQLPTIEEMNEAGFEFYRSKKLSNYATTPTYPDPDFYFIYAEVLTSTVFKQAIMENLQKMESTYDITDMDGALASYYMRDIDNSDGTRTTVGTLQEKNIVATTQASYYKDLFNDTETTTSSNENNTSTDENSTSTDDSNTSTDDNNTSANITDEEKETVFDVNSILKETTQKATTLEAQKNLLAPTLAYLHTPFWNINEKVKLAFREKDYEMLDNFADTNLGQALKERCEAINTTITDILNVSILDMGDYSKNDISSDNIKSYDAMVEWCENRITKALKEVFEKYDLMSLLDLSPGKQSVEVELQDKAYDVLMAAADAATGDTYYNTTYYTQYKIVEQIEDTHTKSNTWKLKCFMNYGNSIKINDDGTFLDNLIPYCKLASGSYATTIDEGVSNGVAFGVFQIATVGKDLIEQIEKKKSTKLNQNVYYFIDPYYRDIQIKQGPDCKDIQDHKYLLLTNPAYCAIAYLRQCLYFYRLLTNQNVIVSAYELLRKEAMDNIYKSKESNNGGMNPEANISYNEVNSGEVSKTVDYGKIADKEIFKPFYELLGILVGMAPDYDSDKRQAIIDDVLKLDKKTDKKLIKALKNGKGTQADLDKFIEKCNKKIADTKKNSKETIARYKVLRQAAQEKMDPLNFAYYIQQYRTAYVTQASINQEGFQALLKIMYDDQAYLFYGHLIALAFAQFSPTNVFSMIRDKNIDSLDRLLVDMASPSAENEKDIIRKYMYALIGRKILDVVSTTYPVQTATSIYQNIINEHVDVWRSNSPRDYLKDSFYDMIHTDKRSRMVRAFPTYYLMFIDEGRDIGLWHLHDNFYSMSSIAEVEVTKSRKLAADTAHIVMTNMFASYMQNDSDTIYNMDLENYGNLRYEMKDVFLSIFSPRIYYEQEELLRQNTEIDITAPLQSGTRLQLRMGYGSNAAELPILFNGQIAEITNGEIVEIVAQGDGVELTNPIVETDNVEDIQNDEEFIAFRFFDNWLTQGTTSRNMLGTILTSEGKWLHKKIKELTNNRFYNTNPFGIFHFGDYRYTQIFQNGECVQNLFETYSQAIYNASSKYVGLENKYRTSEIPKYSVHCEGKTFWDLMHIAASVSPDYICSVVPFEMRSSVFLGAGRYYYAYEYVQDVDPKSGNKIIKEHRKPFEQYHFYNSISDIIENKIYATSKDIHTNAIGYYTTTHYFGSEKTEKVGPLYVDFD